MNDCLVLMHLVQNLFYPCFYIGLAHGCSIGAASTDFKVHTSEKDIISSNLRQETLFTLNHGGRVPSENQTHYTSELFCINNLLTIVLG